MKDFQILFWISSQVWAYYEYMELNCKMDIKYGYDYDNMIYIYISIHNCKPFPSPFAGYWIFLQINSQPPVTCNRRCRGSWNPRPQRSPVCSGAMLIHRFSDEKVPFYVLIGICKIRSWQPWYFDSFMGDSFWYCSMVGIILRDLIDANITCW